MNVLARTALALLCGLGLLAYSLAPASAWPAKPITFVVPYAACGFGDIQSLKIGEKLANREPMGGPPAQFIAFIQRETAKWAAAVKTANL